MNYTYILQCGDGSLYTGWTNHLEKRINMHKTGRGAKYTKAHLPVKLVYCESFPTKEEAMHREWEIKQLSRRQKLALIAKTPWDPQDPHPSES
ncbi:MAG: GIY-YIG nuclease family protein [Lachnospiraceae bacterium]|jgi:putative endonuclease|nr:GIY-YIG nuclease family protein [Lachnospiraceae bacterium]MCI8997274.1 GIY-YIG nuclease family protein [Lachnospiraceae bacterium]MCI9135300.1 GIY-YIG nuclease family protein [Lachnospiraceae bacterium]